MGHRGNDSNSASGRESMSMPAEVNALRLGLAACLMWVAALAGGCNTDRFHIEKRPPKGAELANIWENRPGPNSHGLDVDSAESSEVDLVEAVVSHRAQYVQNLEALRDYYGSRGYAAKRSWAEYELSGLKKVKTFLYLNEAEVPTARLQPTDSVGEADAMYDRAMELMRKGGHGVPIFYREKVMVEAADVLRELIEKYPASDKIDDAAYFLGEIHKEYLPGQELIAVKWYERAWTWNPDTPHPARFHAAVVYDYRLHDRDRALELYKAVVEGETKIQSNVRFAQRRIGQLASGEHAARSEP
ncbi:MAG: hypothetical protein AABZ47_11160 [Planctomycetota bacterium]